jgi:hypothetical protein
VNNVAKSKILFDDESRKNAVFNICSNDKNVKEYDLRQLLDEQNRIIEDSIQKFDIINPSCEAMVEMIEPPLHKNFEKQSDHEDLA